MSYLPRSAEWLGSGEPSFSQRLALLDESILMAHGSARELLLSLRASVVRVQAELDKIHVPEFSVRTQPDAVCFDCGMKNLDVFYTSKYGQYQLCTPCFDARTHHGHARLDGVSRHRGE